MLTLWDLLPTKRKPKPPLRSKPAPKKPAPTKKLSPSAERYETLTRECLKEYGLRVRKWRTSMSGVAWEVTYKDGTVSRLIESPKPKGPMSAAVFLHEVGHHAIGFSRYKPRCLEEYHAWMWSLAEMEKRGVNITDAVRRRVHESLHYAIAKAVRRGLKNLPAELEPYLPPPPRRPSRAPRITHTKRSRFSKTA